MKTSELTGIALDWAVAKCKGATNLRYDTVATWWVDLNGEPRALSSGWSPRQSWHPSTNWAQGGPIIEREKIGLLYVENRLPHQRWDAGETDEMPNTLWPVASGATPLIAAMRCYVASKLGDDIEIPEELL